MKGTVIKHLEQFVHCVFDAKVVSEIAVKRSAESMFIDF